MNFATFPVLSFFTESFSGSSFICNCVLVFSMVFTSALDDAAPSLTAGNTICWGGSCRPADSRPDGTIVRVAVTSSNSRNYGSGTMIRYQNRTYVLTCAHVFESDSVNAAVFFQNDPGRTLRLLAIDRRYDLALLDANHLTGLPATASVSLLAEAAPLPSEPVSVAGFGWDGQLKWTNGSVAGYTKTVNTPTCDTLKASYGLLNPTVRLGDSGGGIFNHSYELVGVLWGSDSQAFYGTQIGMIRKFLTKAVTSVSQGLPAIPPTQPLNQTQEPNGTQKQNVVPTFPGIITTPDQNPGYWLEKLGNLDKESDTSWSIFDWLKNLYRLITDSIFWCVAAFLVRKHLNWKRQETVIVPPVEPMQFSEEEPVPISETEKKRG